jgi:hypothetical protein
LVVALGSVLEFGLVLGGFESLRGLVDSHAAVTSTWSQRASSVRPSVRMLHTRAKSSAKALTETSEYELAPVPGRG